jgi:hypothetical protein
VPSGVGLVVPIILFLAFLINGAVLFLVLSRGRQKHHYLFAGALSVYTITSFSGFLFAFRNSQVDELIIYQSVMTIVSSFVAPCIYHFTCAYLNQPRKKSTIFIWAYAVIVAIFNLSGKVMGKAGPMVLTTSDGLNLYAFQGGATDIVIYSIMTVIPLIFIWLACWFLFRARRRETSPLARRHMLYIIISFLVTLSLVLISLLEVFLEFNELEANRLTGQMQSVVVAIFGALVGIAIVKERLLDITVIIKKTTLYSIFLAIIIFVFSLSEHLLASYVGEFFGEHSIFIHIISIAVVIAVLMPIRQKIERAIERLFAKKTVEF